VGLLAGSSAIALVGAALAPVPAGAQQGQPQPPIEEIVVTGSRIARPELTSSSPVAVVSNQDIRLSGTVNVEQILNEMPQVVPGATTTSNNPGEGIASVDLRGLGPNRTLVLVNGRRFVASTQAGTVDINNIPAALIQRVEVVTGGASAVYGSDAIAGVVNFILRDDFEGLEISTQYDVTGEGDGERFDLSGTLGGNFADGRGNAVVFFNYFDRESVFQGDRDFADEALQDDVDDAGNPILVPGGSIGIPATLITGNVVLPDGTVSAGGARFTDAGVPVPFVSPQDLYNFAPVNYLQVPQTRWAISGIGTYEISDTVEAFLEANFINNRVPQQLAPTPASGTFTINLDNPLLTPENQQFLAQNFGVDADGDGVPESAEFFAARRLVEVGPRVSEDEYNAFRVVGGFRGDLLDRFNWDAYYSFGRVSRSNRLENDASFTRFQQALLVESGPGGTPVCIDPSGGCTPLNIFGAGNISQEAADFIRVGATNTTTIEEQIYAGSISGDAVELPAGPLGFALGVEYRQLESEFSPDEFLASGDVLGFNAGEPTAGDFDVWEMFGEVLVPILSDLPWARSLTLEAGLRYSDYSTVGSVWTYKAGGEYQPVEDLRVRALYQRAVRAPNIAELFQGPSQGFPAYTDPCSELTNTTGPVADLCVAQGIPRELLGTFEQANTQVEAQFSGNPDLSEETSDTYTIGAVFTPTFLPDLAVTIDYYNITLEDAIGVFGGGADNTVSLCFQSLDPNSPFCQAFDRRADGNIDIVNVPNFNTAELQTEGLDLQVNYSLDLPDQADLFGTGDAGLALGFLGTYVLEYQFKSTPEASFIECAGYIGSPCPGPGGIFVGTGTPEWKAVTSATYANGPLSLRLQWRWIGGLEDARLSQAESLGTDAPLVPVPEVDPEHYFDLSFQYDFNDMFQLFGGVENLFDNEPPLLGDAQVQANTDPSLYDVLGRRYFEGVQARF